MRVHRQHQQFSGARCISRRAKSALAVSCFHRSLKRFYPAEPFPRAPLLPETLLLSHKTHVTDSFTHRERERVKERMRERAAQKSSVNCNPTTNTYFHIFSKLPPNFPTSNRLFFLINISHLHILPILSDLVQREEWQANVLQLRDST